MQWSREHDALIARVAEGLEVEEVFRGVPYVPNPARLGHSIPLPAYNTDIAACMRAAEAWRVKENGSAVFGVTSPHDGESWKGWINFDISRESDEDGRPVPFTYKGIHYDTWPNVAHYASTPAEALAWALHTACEATQCDT